MKTSDIIKASVIISIVGFTAAFALSLVNKITSEPISRQDREKKLAALGLVLPHYEIQYEKTVTIDNAPFTYWEGIKEENGAAKKGWAFIAERSGYSGIIQSIVGVDEFGKIIGFTILRQTETPGLGARVQEVASSKTFIDHIFGLDTGQDHVETAWFQVQFVGLDTHQQIGLKKKGDWIPAMRDELLQDNAVTIITGATITVQVIADSIEEGAQRLKKALALKEVKE